MTSRARTQPHPKPSRVGRHTHRKLPAHIHYAPPQSIVDRLRGETTAGILLVIVVALSLAWANSPFKDTLHAISQTKVGLPGLGLNMTIAHWASDGLLAIFFFVVGLELKSEFVTGALRNVRTALLPVLAAVCGMVVPAVVYTVTQALSSRGAAQGWAIPTATDIAFALALLGLLGRGMPPGLRVFLMTLAVVDDLLAIIVIALVYTASLNFVALACAFAVIGLFALLVQRRVTHWWILLPVALAAWALMYLSGVHATIAGVLLGLTVPAITGRREHESLTHTFAHRLLPLSNGLALPIFAFFSAAITIQGGIGMLAHPVAVGVMAGLIGGKVLGIWGGVALLTRFTPLRLTGGVDLPDILAASFLAGIGFTVSLLIAGLSFGEGMLDDTAKFAVVVGSVISALLAAVMLRLRVAVKVRGSGSERF